MKEFGNERQVYIKEHLKAYFHIDDLNEFNEKNKGFNFIRIFYVCLLLLIIVVIISYYIVKNNILKKGAN